VAFNRAIPLGSVVTVETKVSGALKINGNFIDIWVEQGSPAIRLKQMKLYTFVAVDDTGTPVEIPQIIPETELEQQRFDAALRRKQLSLLLAGKMKPEETGIESFIHVIKVDKLLVFYRNRIILKENLQ
jgi:acyl-CoA hydrolase